MEKSQPRKRFSDLQELNMDLIKGIPWAEEMWNVLSNGLRKTFLNWTQIALKMGRKEENMREWVDIFTEHFEDACLELVSDIEQLHSNLITDIEQSLQRAAELCTILHTDLPVFGNENQDLYQERQLLKKHIEKLECLIATRTEEWNKLRQKEAELCHSLGKTVGQIGNKKVPSAEEIQEFLVYIENLEQEKFERLEKYYVLKEKITVLVEELRFKPASQFEKDVLSFDESKFLVTELNMKNLDNFHRVLEDKLKIAKEEVSVLKNKINQYWNLLEIPLLQQEEFKQKCTGRTLDLLEVLRKEVECCESLKKENIKVFVDKLRDQLIEIWEKCKCTESDKNNFRFFKSDCYTEDLLELHEIELKKWNNYYLQAKQILDLLSEHSIAWSKLKELEETAVNPDRFKNRGGQLLKEEKERNTLQKKIPKLEETLHRKANEYEKQHGTIFRSNGRSIAEHIQNLHSEKENCKKQKLSARKIQRENTMSVLTPAKSAQCLFSGASTSKRKLPAASHVSKKAKTCSPKSSNQVKKRTAPKITVTSATLSKRLSTERKKRIEKIRRRSGQKQIKEKQGELNKSTSPEYVEFENVFATRNASRSTMLVDTPVAGKSVNPRTILSEKGTPTGSQTTNNNDLKLAPARTDLNLMF